MGPYNKLLFAISAASGGFSFSLSRTSGVRLSKPVELSLSKCLIAAGNFPWETSFAKTLDMSSTGPSLLRIHRLPLDESHFF